MYSNAEEGVCRLRIAADVFSIRTFKCHVLKTEFLEWNEMILYISKTFACISFAVKHVLVLRYLL